MRTPFHILFYGDYGPGIHTGFANVLTHIKGGTKKILGDKMQADICAMNYAGPLFAEADGTRVCSAVNSATEGGYDEFGRIALAGFLKIEEVHPVTKLNYKYDGLFIFHDTGVILPYVPLYKEVQQDNAMQKKRNFKSIFYTPIDCEYNADSLKNIDWFDCIVTYNEFGKNEILKHRPDLRKKIRTVPHGVDTHVFYPIEGGPLSFGEGEGVRSSFRKEYFGKHADKFIITNVNRNQHRKAIDATILSFIEYRKINANSFLYLHMHPHDPMGWDIRALMLNTDLREGRDYGFPPSHLVNIDGREIEDYQCDEATLNKIYNASDVYLTTTRGEGWGLSVVEAMACCLPVICPLNTSLYEITDNGRRAYVLNDEFITGGMADNIFRGQVYPDEVAEKLSMVYQDIEQLKHYRKKEMTQETRLTEKIERAYQYALSLNWDAIARRWVEIFKEVY